MLVIVSFIITSLLFVGLDFLLDKDPSTFLFIDNFKSNLMFYILFVGTLYLVYSIIKDQKDQYQSRRQRQILEAVEKILNSKRNLMWSQFLSVSYSFHQTIVKDLIVKGIRNNLFYGELKDNSYSQPYLNFISEKTLDKVKIISEDADMNNYKFVEKRVEVENKLDTYLYTSDKEQLRLLRAPFNLLKSRDSKVYAIYDNSKDEDIITINKSDIEEIFYEDLTYDKYNISELWLSANNQTIDDIKVISVNLKDGTVYELIGSSISLDL